VEGVLKWQLQFKIKFVCICFNS